MELRHEWIGRIVPSDRYVSHAGTGRSRGRGPDVERGREAEELLRFGDLAGQGIGRISLVLPSEGGLTHAGSALCSRSTSSDESGDEGGVRTMRRGRRRRGGEGGRSREPEQPHPCMRPDLGPAPWAEPSRPRPAPLARQPRPEACRGQPRRRR